MGVAPLQNHRVNAPKTLRVGLSLFAGWSPTLPFCVKPLWDIAYPSASGCGTVLFMFLRKACLMKLRIVLGIVVPPQTA